MTISDRNKEAVDILFTNGFDRGNAYGQVYPDSTPKNRPRQMYLLLRKPHVKAYYDEKYLEFRELFTVDKFTLVASLIKQVEFFNEVMEMSSEGCPLDPTDETPENIQAIDDWWSRYGRMKDIMSASDYNTAKNMIAKLIGAFEPEKVVIETRTFKVGFDLPAGEITDVKTIE
jgi:hypothetical protein|tara:strand:+ start:466 stop:984 length:519 start_codon:yes stop_codon:yes gene_type:complete